MGRGRLGRGGLGVRCCGVLSAFGRVILRVADGAGRRASG